MASYKSKASLIICGKTNKMIKEWFPLMKNGRYQWNYTLSYISLLGEKTGYLDDITDIALSNSKGIKRIISKFINSVRPINNTGHNPENEYGICAETLLFSCAHNDIKLFDLDNKIVLSKFSEAARFNAIIEGKRKFGEIMPVLDGKIYNNNIIVERMINSNTNGNAQDYFDHFLQLYIKYYKSTNISKIPSSSFLEAKSPIGVSKYYPFISNDHIVMCKQHGDFWKGNILCENGNYYLIDFEKYGDHFFLCDLLYYWLVEFVNNDNIEGIKYYFEGKYDSYLKEIQRELSIEEKNTKELFADFVVYMWYVKWKNENNYPMHQLDLIYKMYYVSSFL